MRMTLNFSLASVLSIAMLTTQASFAQVISDDLTAQAQITSSAPQSAEDRQLEQMLTSEVDQKSAPVVIEKPAPVKQRLSLVNRFKAITAKIPNCVDATKTVLNGRYVMTADASGKACRLYDLSFPNLKALFVSNKSLQIPVQAPTSKDYINWLNGNTLAMQQSEQQYRNQFNAQRAAVQSWTSKLQFRVRPTAVAGSQSALNSLGLPQSFRLSDLNLGTNFQFDAQTIAEFEKLMASTDKAALGENDPFAAEVMDVAKKPDNLLKKIQFNWDDVNKVYDVVIEGHFLPLSGPVALVDYQKQYRFAVEKMVRSMLSSGLQNLARQIPHPLISSLVEVVVTDAFEQLELMYDYQMRLLEGSLRGRLQENNLTATELADTNRALNLLYGQKADLFSNYILSVAQGKPFDWTAFEKMGKAERYTNEKMRDIQMSRMNSKLVLEKKCQTEMFQDYFAICSKNNMKDSVYSLISERMIFSKSLGAPMIYRFQRPYEATLVRGGAWVLSAALRVFGLPVARGIVGMLDRQLKSFMQAGLTDEALLRSRLSLQQSAGALTAENSMMLKWLYIQNLNPFLPKSATSESRMIAANKKLLGLNSVVNSTISSR